MQPHAKAVKMRVLAVLSPGRSPIFSDAPTIAESGYPGFKATVWYCLVVPAAWAPALLARPQAEVQRALTAPELANRLVGAGAEVLPGPTERLAALLVFERSRCGPLICEARIKPD